MAGGALCSKNFAAAARESGLLGLFAAGFGDEAALLGGG
jgi:hypothetical protein